METFLLRLKMAVTEWDMREEKKKGYNPYGLGIYLQSIEDNVVPALNAGKARGDAIAEGFISGTRFAAFIARELHKKGELKVEDVERLKRG